jgi:hypothetical protein
MNDEMDDISKASAAGIGCQKVKPHLVQFGRRRRGPLRGARIATVAIRYRGFAMLLSCSLLMSCYSNSVENLRNEAARLAPVGTPLATAISRAGAAGFVCEDMSPVICKRNRLAGILKRCTEGFLLLSDSKTFSVIEVEEPRIICAGP